MSGAAEARARRRRWRVPRALGAMLAGLAIAWGAGFAWFAEDMAREAPSEGTRADAIVVLTGGAAALRAGLDLLGKVDLRANVARIPQPALLIAGQNDRVTPPSATRWIASMLPAAQYAEIPRAGHASFISHTDEFLGLLRPFLQTQGVVS